MIDLIDHFGEFDEKRTGEIKYNLYKNENYIIYKCKR